MLSIENITKVYGKDVGNWRIGKVETLPSAYLFTLQNVKGDRIQINLERIAIGVQYELWRWNSYGNQSPHPNSVPMRRMLDRSKLLTPDKLINEIKELMYR